MSEEPEKNAPESHNDNSDVIFSLPSDGPSTEITGHYPKETNFTKEMILLFEKYTTQSLSYFVDYTQTFWTSVKTDELKSLISKTEAQQTEIEDLTANFKKRVHEMHELLEQKSVLVKEIEKLKKDCKYITVGNTCGTCDKTYRSPLALFIDKAMCQNCYERILDIKENREKS